MLVGENFQRLDYLTESLIGIFINDDLIEVLLVNSLYTSTFLQGIFKIFLLENNKILNVSG